ncbi:MAG: lysophospholipid acyltransferase family protein [Poseidonibacter sp.]|uniref:lysophospholipid acyltransferase family protein n=1 Tax=Poseidonibacter sp. TaxID=2321188 RepID=UPI00359E0365
MNFRLISLAIYSTYLTNKFGILLKKAKTTNQKMQLRNEYAKTLFKKLNITLEIKNKEKIPQDGKYLLISNHKSIIDPLIVELALEQSNIYGHWIAKKELYNSFFFGLFTRNAGSILLDRESKNMSSFFKDVKDVVKEGHSIFIFPEGTRNKEDIPISNFKEGARLIALKNRLPILPVYIKTNANVVLKEAINNKAQNLVIQIEIGDIIEYKDKTPLEDNYKNIFSLS